MKFVFNLQQFLPAKLDFLQLQKNFFSADYSFCPDSVTERFTYPQINLFTSPKTNSLFGLFAKINSRQTFSLPLIFQSWTFV